MGNKFYVYALVNPITKLPFYIGKGTKKRCFDHLNGKIRGENCYKDHTIDKIRSQGFEPTISILKENLTEQMAYEFEEELILTYGRKTHEENGILTNICLSKRPPSQKGKKFSDETKEKMSKATKGKRKGPMSQETKDKLSMLNKGKLNPNYKRNPEIPAWNKGLTKETDERVIKYTRNSGNWNRGLTKETDNRIAERSEKMKFFWETEKGKLVLEETAKKIGDKLRGKKRGSAPLLKAWETRRKKNS